MPIPVDLSKLSDVVKNDVVVKTVYDKLVTKINSIDTSSFVLKTNYDRDNSEIENKIPDNSGLVKKADCSTKITEIEDKMPRISGFATNATLTAVENKIPNISSLVQKSDYNTKITEIEKELTDHNHNKYITTPEFNNMAASVFHVRLAQANLITKADFDAKLLSLNPTQYGLFRGCSRTGAPKKALLPKICHTYPTMMKLGTVILYPKKIQKIYESRDAPLAFC